MPQRKIFNASINISLYAVVQTHNPYNICFNFNNKKVIIKDLNICNRNYWKYFLIFNAYLRLKLFGSIIFTAWYLGRLHLFICVEKNNMH